MLHIVAVIEAKNNIVHQKMIIVISDSTIILLCFNANMLLPISRTKEVAMFLKYWTKVIMLHN